jgi:hypothetical protein
MLFAHRPHDGAGSLNITPQSRWCLRESVKDTAHLIVGGDKSVAMICTLLKARKSDDLTCVGLGATSSRLCRACFDLTDTITSSSTSDMQVHYRTMYWAELSVKITIFFSSSDETRRNILMFNQIGTAMSPSMVKDDMLSADSSITPTANTI